MVWIVEFGMKSGWMPQKKAVQAFSHTRTAKENHSLLAIPVRNQIVIFHDFYLKCVHK